MEVSLHGIKQSISANLMIIHPFIFFLCILLPPTATSTFDNQTDLLSLLAFKSSLQDPQGALHSWNKTVNFCNWRGIHCGRRHPDRVVEINLMSRGLVGSLSPNVGNLSFLRSIILQNNTFHGPIPTEITLLRRLEYVNFSNNSFTGPIPRNLSHCSNLVSLNLIDNKLSGNIPAELGSLSKLGLLGLGLNNISGHIPSTIGNISSLTVLSLGKCSLMGAIPDSLAQLQNLEFLQLGINHLTGSIPPALFNISSLHSLGFRDNHLDGVIPSTIGLTLPYLRRLYLSRNQFSGPIPGSISNASLLELLALGWNHFTGPMPRVDKLTHLLEFHLTSNLIDDDISFVSSLINATNLETLQVGNNLLTGSLPDSVANLSTHLRVLNLYSNKIHGNIPPGIGNLIGLANFAVSDNYLDGPIPADIEKLSNLLYLYMRGNRFTGRLTSSFENYTLLSTLTLKDNNFSGNVPSSLGNCTNLLELDLSYNNFNGLMPPSIMKLTSISIRLDLSYNSLDGPIPSEVDLTHLRKLDLSNNRLSGSIPNSLEKCTSLEKLYLEGNLLEGEIPTGMSALMGLRAVDLSRNNLSGAIPKFLEKQNLEYLNLSFNRLHGEVPTTGVFKNISSISVDGNEQLCGGISELQLPPCYSRKHHKGLSLLFRILIPILVAGGVCLVHVVCFIRFASKKKMSRRYDTSMIGIQFIRLSYSDLLKATGGFSEANLLGIGRFGSVYRGILEDGQTQIAVKVLNLFVRGASKSFFTECNALRDTRHRNLLKILSVCESIDFQGNDFKALVYEFKANGSLEKWLHHSRLHHSRYEEGQETNRLSIVQRLDIAIDIAQAIEYLHFGTNSSVIHGDLKPSNILLDHDMTACVGDFGLAKIVSDIAPSHESSASIIRGTIGYVPPEYGTSHSVSTQGDVYSFGIILLEMLTNKRPTDDLFMDHVNLHNLAASALPNRVMEIVDPQLQTAVDIDNGKMKDCVTCILSIGVSCSQEILGDRMPMTDVVKNLQNIRKMLSG